MSVIMIATPVYDIINSELDGAFYRVTVEKELGCIELHYLEDAATPKQKMTIDKDSVDAICAALKACKQIYAPQEFDT